MEQMISSLKEKVHGKNSLLLKKYENLPRIQITNEDQQEHELPRSPTPVERHWELNRSNSQPTQSGGRGSVEEAFEQLLVGSLTESAEKTEQQVENENRSHCSTSAPPSATIAHSVNTFGDNIGEALLVCYKEGKQQQMISTQAELAPTNKQPRKLSISIMDSLMPGHPLTKNDRLAINRQSTGTLNRLFLVAQALENELDTRQSSGDLNGGKIVYTIRIANIILLVLIILLLFTGIGQYYEADGARISIWLTIDKWHSSDKLPTEVNLPPTFKNLHLTGQICATGLAVGMLFASLALQSLHYAKLQHSRILCIFNAFACVPFGLFIFGMQMHYSSCPWLDDFYRTELGQQQQQTEPVRFQHRTFGGGGGSLVEQYFDTQCGINGWSLAGIFSLLSTGLFIGEGLMTAFLRTAHLQLDEGECCPPDKPAPV